MRDSESKPFDEYVGGRGIALSGALGFILPVAALLATFAGLSKQSGITTWLGGICMGIFIAPHLAIWVRATASDVKIAELSLTSNMPPSVSRWLAYTIIMLSLVLSGIAVSMH